jgi:phosphoglycerate dehydrogenase-like enzyme
MRVLYLGAPALPEWQPFGEDILRVVGRAHDVITVDARGDIRAQVRDPAVAAVVDHGLVDRAGLPDAAAGHVRLWQLGSVGYDGVDIAAFHRSGVPLARCPGSGSARALAEHALMLALMVGRHHTTIARIVDAGELRGPTGRELSGRALLVIGLGASGLALASRAVALGMRVSAVRRQGSDERARKRLGLERLLGLEALDDELRRADLVSLHVPYAPSTRRLLDRRRLSLLRAGAIVINVSRGGLIDESALAEAVREGRIAGAGLDVVEGEPARADHPLRGIPDVIITSHIAGNTYETSLRRARFALANIDRVARGCPPLCVVTASSD